MTEFCLKCLSPLTIEEMSEGICRGCRFNGDAGQDPELLKKYVDDEK
jgi:hypothetical protein